jgi:ComF family protein
LAVITAIAARLLAATADALFPPRCPACRVLTAAQRLPPLQPGGGSGPRPAPAGLREAGLCAACRADVRLLGSPRCTVCGRPFASPGTGDHPCGTCLHTPPTFHTARAAGRYQGSLQALVRRLKFGGRADLARPLGRMLRAAFESGGQPQEVDWVVPVPLHRRRLRQRGFNQALLLADAMLATGAVASRPVLNPAVLQRHRATAPQTGLDPARRRANTRGAFSVGACAGLRGKRVLLVDDVFTTGATAEACTRALLAGGAQRVDVLTLARATGGPR